MDKGTADEGVDRLYETTELWPPAPLDAAPITVPCRLVCWTRQLAANTPASTDETHSRRTTATTVCLTDFRVWTSLRPTQTSAF